MLNKILERKLAESARDYACRIIKERIIHLELAPESIISEQEIAQELKVSRTPVREALISLSQSKIITIIPQKGCYISKIDYALVDEARFMRLQLEKGVVEILCDYPEYLDVIQLEENLKLQEFFMNYGDTDKFFELDNEFHKLLFNLANKSQAYELMESMQVHFDRVRRMKLETKKEALELFEDHKLILKALVNRDVEGVVALISLHLSRYKVDQSYLQKKYKSYFV